MIEMERNESQLIMDRMCNAVMENQNRIAALSTVLAKELADKIGQDPNAVTIACVAAALTLARLLVSNHPMLLQSDGDLDMDGFQKVCAAYVRLAITSYDFRRVQ